MEALIASAVARFGRWRERRRTIRALRALDDWLLKDVGVRRSEIPAVVDRLLSASPAAAVGPGFHTEPDPGFFARKDGDRLEAV